MKKVRHLPVLTAALLLTSAAVFAADPVPPVGATSQPATQSLLPILEKNADGQLTAMADKAPSDWTAATFYVGLAALSHVSTNPKYAKAAYDIADKNHWQVHEDRRTGTKRRFFADDQAVGQLYIDLAVSSHDVKLLDPLIKEETALLGQLENFDPLVSNPGHNAKPETTKMEPIPWWWCDSLFMNPPVLARLAAVTGDQKFLDGMDHAYWQTADLLYDKDEHLFYRDNRFIGEKSKNGKKVFWSRGDGWVMGGLCQVLTYMPENHATREKYVTLFKDMAAKIVTLQNDDGLWSPSLLDPQDPTFTETSGSAFFTYAFAWGVNHGLLERDKYAPAAEKGWAALTSKLRPDGQLGFVQPVGFKPDGSQPITIDNTQYYGNGAFLLAGCELIKLHAEVTPAK